MLTDAAGRLDLDPDIRLTGYAYQEVFGQPPAVVWQVPGTVTLLASGPLRLTVAARWGAIAAAGPQPGGLVELVRMERPGDRTRLAPAQAAAGTGPAWAGTGLRAARTGAAVLVNTSPPPGSGLGTGAATEAAIGLALGELAAAGLVPPPGAAGLGPHALLGGRPLPFDLAAVGLRLLVIDPRVRGVPQPAPAERAPVAAAAAALAAGDIAALGPMLTAVHHSLDRDRVQDLAVSAALAAGALGARMITDGPGRPACALLPAARLASVRAAVVAAFAAARLRPPRLLTVSPADGPRRAL
jgi:galactokinase